MNESSYQMAGAHPAQDKKGEMIADTSGSVTDGGTLSNMCVHGHDARGSRPDLVEGFTRKTFTAMIEGVREAE